MTRSRKDRGLRTERLVQQYLSQWWESAAVGRGAGKDVLNVPFDIEIKARSSFQPLAFLKQSEARAKGQEKSIVVCRMNGQAFITVTLESVVSSHEPQVKVRLRKTGGVMEIMTSELIPVQKSYFDHTNSVTSQRWWSEQRTL